MYMTLAFGHHHHVLPFPREIFGVNEVLPLEVLDDLHLGRGFAHLLVVLQNN